MAWKCIISARAREVSGLVTWILCRFAPSIIGARRAYMVWARKDFRSITASPNWICSKTRADTLHNCAHISYNRTNETGSTNDKH